MHKRIGLRCVSEKKRDDARDCNEQTSTGALVPDMPCSVLIRHDKTHTQNDQSSGAGRSCVVQTDIMPKKMLIDATHAEETRVVVVDGNKVEEFDFESENRRQLAGNIYLAKVTRVEPSLQAAFVDYGGNRHGFLAFSEIHPDYYQIPVADREALLEEERAYAQALKDREDEEEKEKPKRRTRTRSRSKAAAVKSNDAVTSTEVQSDEIKGMETIDLDENSASEEEAVEAAPQVDLGQESASEDQTQALDHASEPLEQDAPDAPQEASNEAPSSDENTGDDNTGDNNTGEETPEVEAPKEEAAAEGSQEDTDEGTKEAEAAPDAMAQAQDDTDTQSDSEESPKNSEQENSEIESVAQEDDSDEIRPAAQTASAPV